ncbi:MAG: alkaline phosphatase family protein [Candidatus Helarchaeota archaeon]
MNSYNHVILVIIDDVRADQFFELIEKGILKNIANYFTDGLYCKECITTYVSTTAPAHNSILTGCYMNNYDIPSLKFVDRSQEKLKVIDYTLGLEGLNINQHMNKDIKTIFEMMDGNTFSAAEWINRGATRTEYTISVDRGITKSFLEPTKYFEENETPTLCVGWYFESDVILHEYGSHSEMYVKILKSIDKSLGRLARNLIKNGYFDDTLFVITSDHGNYAAGKKKDLPTELKKSGLVDKKDYYADFGGVGLFYFKEDQDWRQRPSLKTMEKYGNNGINLFDTILTLDGVQQIYYRDEDCKKDKGIIYLKSHNGEGMIEYKDGKTKYTFEKKDFFNYEKDPIASKLLDGKYHSIDEWLKYTYHIDNPLVVDQIPRLLNTAHQRSADIIAETDVSTIYNHLYSHDVGLKSAMTVPLLISGRGLEKKEITFAKVADITPTILKLTGKRIDPKIIGRPLI